MKPRLIAATPSASIAVVLLPQAIRDADRSRTAQALTSLYLARGNASITLFTWNGSELLQRDVVTTLPAWQKSVQQALSRAEDATAAGGGVHEALIHAASALRGNWASVLLIGLPQDVAPDSNNYLLPWLAGRLCGLQLRVSYWTPDSRSSELWNYMARVTTGASHLESLEEFPLWAASGPFYEATWTPAFSRGFVVERAKWEGVEFPLIVASPGAQLPSPSQYAELRRIGREFAALIQDVNDAARAERARKLLADGLAINPLDEELLRLGAQFYSRFRDYATAAKLLSWLAEARPADFALKGELGHDLYLAGSLEAAEKYLLAAKEAGVAGPSAAEELARIHIARRDHRAALPFLDEALQADSRRADLWFLRADTSVAVDNLPQAAESLEKGLALDPQALERRTALIALYLRQDHAERALPHVRTVASAPPADAGALRTYAEFLERLEKPDEAAALWKSALGLDPRLEEAHLHLGLLLLKSGKFAEALAAAEAGLPGSPRLLALRADALEGGGRYYAARDSLREATKALRDPDLLARLALMEDVSGTSAAAAYAAAVSVQAGDSNTRFRLMERGLETALRDGDSTVADSFRNQLVTAGRRSVTAWLSVKPRDAEVRAVVPGGLEALAFMAHTHAAAPHQFFAQYSRALIARGGGQNAKENRIFLQGIHDYFQTLAGLRSLGKPNGAKVELTISVDEKDARQKSAKILELLGWTLKAGKDGVTVEAGGKLSQARRQEIASALAIDTIAMQEAVKARRRFTFEIVDGEALVLFGESKWTDAFSPKEKPPGGFAEMLASELKAAKVYCGLTAMDRRAASALAAGSDLKLLGEKYSDLIFRAGSGLAFRGDSAAVPGGVAAETIWERLVGAPPSKPGRFFMALLQKDDGMGLAFFNQIGQLDDEHQRFFTRSPSRAKAFYDLFRESPDMARGADAPLARSSLIEFLREIPLDDSLRLQFPGSAEVWMVAHGNSSASKAVSMTKRLSRVTVPEKEDEILIRLVKTRYKDGVERFTETENFVAIVRIDRHRREPLDDLSTMLLAQNFPTLGSMYPYFATLSEVSGKHFQLFFQLTDKWRDASWEQLNPILAQFHSLVELLCLARETDALPGAEAAELFGLLCARFIKSENPADYTSASLETVRDLIARLGAKDSDPDAAVERMLFRGLGTTAWITGGEPRSVDLFSKRRASYRQVQAAQRVTSLHTLLEIDRLLRAIAEGKGNAAEHVKAIESLLPGLLSVAPDKKIRTGEVSHKVLAQFDAGRLPAVFVRLKQRTSRKAIKLEELKKARVEFLDALAPYTQVALSGIVYGYFLDPADLIVASDALLIRKHQYVTREKRHPTSTFSAASDGAGSHFSGGFAQFHGAIGEAIADAGKGAGGTKMAAVQLGVLRGTAWGHLTEDDIRRFGLRVRLAREWILHAAADDSLQTALFEETAGALSPARRTQLMDAIAYRDWDGAMGAVTLGDLFTLSVRYLQRFSKDSWSSPVLSELRKSGALPLDPQLQWLGSSAVELMGCSHSHLSQAGPYEHYERLLLPEKLAERAAEFKLALADAAGKLGVPPSTLFAVAQPLALRALSGAEMSDSYDWRAIVTAWQRVDARALQSELEGLK